MSAAFHPAIVLLLTLMLAIAGAFFGIACGRFSGINDVVTAMVRQMDTMGYILTFVGNVPR